MGVGSGQAVWPHYLSGWIAGMTNVTITFPINKVIFRQQIYGVDFRMALRQVILQLGSMMIRITSYMTHKDLTASDIIGVYRKIIYISP